VKHPNDPIASPWLTADEAAQRLRINRKTLYSEVRNGKCRAARIGGRRNLRFLSEWLDEYLRDTVRVEPLAVRTRRPA
jgi:excisionase family DNA binding protein